MNSRTSMAQHEETIRRTVYVSDIDQQVHFVLFLSALPSAGLICVKLVKSYVSLFGFLISSDCILMFSALFGIEKLRLTQSKWLCG